MLPKRTSRSSKIDDEDVGEERDGKDAHRDAERFRSARQNRGAARAKPNAHSEKQMLCAKLPRSPAGQSKEAKDRASRMK